MLTLYIIHPIIFVNLKTRTRLSFFSECTFTKKPDFHFLGKQDCGRHVATRMLDKYMFRTI
jgi:hypothetical protein